jgi:4-oxalocrotonate tautomerase
VCRYCDHRLPRDSPRSGEGEVPLINFKAIEGVLAPEQKRELIEKLTDATAAVYGEGIRQVTWVIIEDVTSGEWGIAGKPVTNTDVKGLLKAGEEVGVR